MATAIPNLYLKWLAVRELLNPPQSNAELAARLWGADEGPPKFSKMLRGDYGCEIDVAVELAEVVNKRLLAVRALKGQTAPLQHAFRSSDFDLPVADFVKRIIACAQVIDDGALDHLHRALVAEFAPAPARLNGPQLAIERFAGTRFFEGVQSASEGPPVFEIGRHKGQFAVDGLSRELLQGEIKAYAFIARDAAQSGARFWDEPFGQNIRWFPSPFSPTTAGDRVLLMPEPKPVQPVVGYFHATTVLAFDESVIRRLDPRGAGAPTQALDEQETARFLTNMSRVVKSHPKAVTVCSGTYIVQHPQDGVA
jgi:hypothetical protein